MADQQRAASNPAPRTIAPSREDVLSNLAFFFGDPVVPERLRDYSEHHAMTFHFPDAVRRRRACGTACQDLPAASHPLPSACSTTARTPRSGRR